MALRIQQTTANSDINKTTVAKNVPRQEDVAYKKVDDELYQQLAASLNISVGQLKAIIETKGIEFIHYSPKKQAEVINDFNKTADVNSAGTTSTSKDNAVSEEKPSFNKAEFNNLKADEKQKVILEEFAKNIFIYGAKDKDGNIINGAVPHSEEEWNNLTKEQQQAQVQKFVEFIKNDPKLTTLFNDFAKKAENLDETKKSGLVDNIQNLTINTIQVANQEGKSVLEYMMMEDGERLDALDRYLADPNNQDNLTDSDRKYIQIRKKVNENVAAYVKEHFGEEIEGNITSSQAEDYLKYYNITYQEVRFDQLDKKVKNGEKLSVHEEKFYNSYKEYNELPAYQEMTIKAKAQNLKDLEAEYNVLQQKVSNGEQLSEVETKHLNMLEKTLNSHEAKHLKDVKFAQPETELEKSAVEFMQSINQEVNNYVKDDHMNIMAKNKAIEEKLASLPKEERAEFLKAIIKFDNSESSLGIYKHFLEKEEYSSLIKEIDILDKSSLVAHECDEAIFSEYAQVAEEAYNGNDEASKRIAKCAFESVTTILKRAKYNKNEEYDSKKLILGESLSRVNDLELHKAGIDVATTMKGDEVQAKAVDVLQNGQYANDELQVYITDRAPDLNVANQEKVVCTAMDKSAEATKNVSGKDIISKLDTSVQTNVFGAAHQNINKWFEGADAIKYSNSLADQIQNCAPENQLAMHNEMMTSKYSEVQEHVASNINTYDKTVQQDALESVYKSGNEKAIGNAIESFVSNKDTTPAQQDVWAKSKIQNTIIGGLSNDQTVLDLAQRIRSGQALTADEYNSLSVTEKSKYKMACFKALPSGKQIAILTQITDTNMKKAIYKHIATTDKAFLKDLIESDADTAKFILKNIPGTRELVLQVAEFKAPSDIAYANLFGEFTKSNEHNNNTGYTSVPGFKDPKYYIFPKDKGGTMIG